MRLWIVRHGQTAWNAEFRAQGHTDIPLDPGGERQAQLLAQALCGVKPYEIWTSDLLRARKTAEIVREMVGGKLRIDSRLRERSFGGFEGLAFRELHSKLVQKQEKDRVDAFNVRPPNGESLKDAFARLQPIAKELFRVKEDRIIVGHGASCSLLIAHLIRGSVETSRSFRFGNTGITEFIRRPEGQFQMLRYNDTSHLSEGDPVLAGAIDGVERN